MPDTIDDWITVLKAFRDGDPNGNGLKDEIQLLEGGPAGIIEWGPFKAAYGLLLNYGGGWAVDKGKISYAWLSPKAKDYVALLKRLYTESIFRREEFDEAISRATEAIEMDEACLPAYAMRAGAHWYSEQLVEAIDDYSRLIEEDGDDFHALAGRGQVYAELGEFDLALADLERAIALGQKRGGKTGLAYAYNGRALVLAGLGRLDEALRDFDRLHGASVLVTDQDRLLISLRYQQELSYEEIAQVLSVPLGSVKTGLFRARAQLKHALLAHQESLQEAG